MPRSRSGIRSLTPKKRKPRKSWADKAKKIRQFTSLPFNNRAEFTEAQKRVIRREYDKYKHVSKKMLHKVSAPKKRLLKEKGYTVTTKGVILDAPRTALGKRLKGSRMTVLKGGIVKESVRERRDYIIGMDKKQRRKFAVDPKSFVKELLKHAKSPALRKSKKQYIRLQWGAFSGRIDYKLENLADYFLDEKGKIKGRLIKNLTGIRIITYVEKTKKRKKRAKGKNS